MWCMMGKRQGAEAGGWRRREEGDKLQNAWLWAGELSRLKDSDHQTCTAGQRGNVIVKPGCGSPQAWLLLLVGRKRTDAATLTMAVGRWFCHNWKFLLFD